MRNKVKGERWAFAPFFAQQSFIISIVLVIITIILNFTFIWLARILYTIPLTIILSQIIATGIVGTVIGSISLHERKNLFGILGVIFSILVLLWNVFLMIILHWDAAFSVP